MRKKPLLSFIAILMVPMAGRSLDLSKVDLRPLVRVQSDLRTPAPVAPSITVLDDHDMFISRGGALENIRIFSEGNPFALTLGRGIGTSTQLANLQQALASSRVGILRDCELEPDGTVTGSHRIVWYGKGNRKNEFQVILGGRQTTGLSLCSPEVVELLAAFSDFEDDVLRNPGSELLRSR